MVNKDNRIFGLMLISSITIVMMLIKHIPTFKSNLTSQISVIGGVFTLCFMLFVIIIVRRKNVKSE
jgi:hypothetical protein